MQCNLCNISNFQLKQRIARSLGDGLASCYKKLCNSRWTVRCNVSVKILLTAAQQCRNNLYDKSKTNQSNGLRGLQ